MLILLHGVVTVATPYEWPASSMGFKGMFSKKSAEKDSFLTKVEGIISVKHRFPVVKNLI